MAAARFVSFADQIEPEASKLRGKPERLRSTTRRHACSSRGQTPPERAHIINAFRFDSLAYSPAIRERMVSGLMNVDREFAEAVATGLGMRTMPAPMPKMLETDVTPEVDASPALSLMARPGDGSIKARRIAILVADGAENRSLEALARECLAAGAFRAVGPASVRSR